MLFSERFARLPACMNLWHRTRSLIEPANMPVAEQTNQKLNIQKNIMKAYYALTSIRCFAAAGIFCLASSAQAQTYVAPYANDAYTVLLDHLDGSTSANILAYTNNGAACGTARPSAVPSYSS